MALCEYSNLARLPRCEYSNYQRTDYRVADRAPHRMARGAHARILTIVVAGLTASATALRQASLQVARRSAVAGAAAIFATGVVLPANAAGSLADRPFEWSAAYGSAVSDTAPKRTGLSLTDLAKTIEVDLKDRKYILTGDLSPEIFRDDARFQDPNNAVDGLSRYRTALSLLFRPEESGLEDVRVRVDAAANTIEADYVAYGTLKLPWRPRIAPWRGHIQYTVDERGLIASQIDVWNITRFDAVRQTFTPGKS